jgi:hypothetical protein
MGALGGVMEMVVVVAIIGGGFIFITKYLPGILQKVQAGGTGYTGGNGCILDNATQTYLLVGTQTPCNPNTGAATTSSGTSNRINKINKLVGYTGPTFPSGQPKCLIGDTACYKAGLAHVFTAHSLNRISNRSHG